jgi:hypothetical protein
MLERRTAACIQRPILAARTVERHGLMVGRHGLMVERHSLAGNAAAVPGFHRRRQAF